MKNMRTLMAMRNVIGGAAVLLCLSVLGAQPHA